jgi:hypothetical protein
MSLLIRDMRFSEKFNLWDQVRTSFSAYYRATPLKKDPVPNVGHLSEQISKKASESIDLEAFCLFGYGGGM